MNKKATDIVAYLSWAGLLVAFLAGDRASSRFHLNQALVLQLVSTAARLLLGWIPLIGGALKLVASGFMLMLWLIAFVDAIQGREKEIPLLGRIHLM